MRSNNPIIQAVKVFLPMGVDESNHAHNHIVDRRGGRDVVGGTLSIPPQCDHDNDRGRFFYGQCNHGSAGDNMDRKQEVKKMIFHRKCDECNQDYESLTPWGRYCSDACKMRAYRRRKANDEKIIQPAATERPTIDAKRTKRIK